MGGTSGCCVEKNPRFDSKLEHEAQQNGHLSRQSHRYNTTQNKSEEHEAMINKEQWNRNHIDHVVQNPEQNRNRGSITELIPNNNEYNNNNHNKNIALSNIPLSRTRGSYDDELESEIQTSSKKKKRKHSSSHHKKKKKKHKNKLVSELRECLLEFNKSMKSISLLELMSTENTMNEYNQNELLDVNEICKYFKNKKYDIQWFLCTKRNKFIVIIVNKWSNISILTTIKIFNMLQEKIHKITPSVSKSTLNLVTTLNSKTIGKRTKSSRKHQDNIMFTWKDHINDIDDCDIHHFLYIASLVIKNENRAKLQSNALFKQSMMGEYQPLYNQFDMLTYLLEIKMNGYLFRGITKHIFFVNIDKFVIDNDTNRNIEYEEILIKNYCDNLYSKIDTFDVSKIYKQSACTIEFTLSNSKRWESVSSLIATMQASEYGLQIDDSLFDEEEESEEEEEDDDDEEESGSTTNNDYDYDEKDIVTPRTTLQHTKNITQAIMNLRNQKDNISAKEYAKKMDILQQKLADSLQIT